MQKLNFLNAFILFLQAVLAFIRLRLSTNKRHAVRKKGIIFSHAVIETHIRMGSTGRFNIDSNAFSLLFKSYKYEHKARRLILQGRFGMMLGGDECYIEASILAQLCEKFQIPYFFIKEGYHGLCVGFKLVKNSLYAGPDPDHLVALAGQLPEQFKTEVENELRNVAFGKGRYLPLQKRNFVKDERLAVFNGAVVIFLHDFLDSPGWYGDNVFIDQYEWLYRIMDITQKYPGINVIFKYHPAFREWNIRILDKLIKDDRFKKVIIFRDDVSVAQIKEAGARAVLTMFGSVMYEAAFVDLPVLACSSHPGIKFDLAYTASTLKEFDDLLNGICRNQVIKGAAASAAVLAFGAQKYLFQTEFLYNGPYEDVRREHWDQVFNTIYDPEHDIGWIKRKEYFNYSLRLKKFVELEIDKQSSKLLNKVADLTGVEPQSAKSER
jgi:hypothetical protein